MNRITRILLLAILLCGQLFGQQHKEDLPSLIKEALQNNPEIRSYNSNVEMLSHRVPQAKALDDPQFTYSLMEFPGIKTNEAKFQNFGLMQMVMFPTKLSLKKQIAELDVQRAQNMYSEKILDIVAELKSSYSMLWGARASLAINRENQRLLNQILRATQTQYAVGKVTQQDVLRTNIELEKTRNEEAVLQQEIASSESMLQTILNRTIRPIGIVSYDDLFPIDRSLEEIFSFARRSRPMLVSDSLGIVQANRMLQMSKQEYIPDFSIGVERVTMPAGGIHMWNIMASISIPFAPWSLSKASARVEEATADRGDAFFDVPCDDEYGACGNQGSVR